MSMIRIAQAQINTTVGAFHENSSKITRMIEKATDQGADIITFPELSVCGYPPEDLLLKPDFLEDNLKALHMIRERTGKTAVVIGHAHLLDGRVYNAASVLQNGRLKATYHKVELPNYGVFDEKRYFTEGARATVLEVNRTRLNLTICEDIWIEGGFQERVSREGRVDLVLNISASPFHAGKLDVRHRIASRFALKSRAFICLNNLVGGQDELVFDGGAFVMDPRGRVVAQAERFDEDLLITDIRFDLHGRTRPLPHDPSSELLVPIEPCSRQRDGELSPTMAREYGRPDEIYRALVLGTGDYVRKNGFRKVLIGLSGGIDSSLTAAVAVDALGPENVIGVTMPSQYTSGETLTDAEILADNLRIKLYRVPITPVYEAYLKATGEIMDKERHGVAHENIQARIRGNILMAISNQSGWLVLTTGNKSEIAVGYCTLYGDMAGGFAVIKDVPKTMVFELSEYVNSSKEREVIPATVISRPPSAELRPDQKDEDTLPPYSMLDAILHAYVEEDRAPEEIVEAGFDRETVKEVVRMVDLNEYKRRQAPPGVKITPKAFGRDRRLPITNAYLRTLR